jgi:hypothetical protein
LNLGSPLNVFRELGDDVLRAWKQHDCDTDVFPQLALESLTRRPVAGSVSIADVVRWVVTSRPIVPQRAFDSDFAQPAVTVYTSDRFYMDVYFWVDATTTIHRHGFAGAFQVLEGGSVETSYSFAQHTQVDEHLATGELRLLDVRRLRRGDTRCIHPGAATIHSLFHLERPSATLVVRTPHVPSAGLQCSYDKPGIAVYPPNSSESVVRTRQCLELLARIGHPERRALAQEAVRGLSASDAFHLLDAAMGLMPTERDCLDLASVVAAEHPALASVLESYVGEKRRQLYLMSLRRHIHSAQHRFLLAVLLTVPSRERLLDLVAEAEPLAPPVDTILRWLREMTRDMNGKIGAPPDEFELGILRHLLHGASDDMVLDALRSTLGASETNLRAPEVIRGFRASDMFRGILAEHAA